MLIEINPSNIDERLIEQAVQILRKGGIIIFPTDTVYAMGCDLYNKKALNTLASLKGIKLKKANFSIICSDLSHLSDYVKHIDRPTYKLLNKSLPGPFTFILTATNEIPRRFDTNKKEVGIRIPDNAIIRSIVEQLGNPVATTSLHDDEDEILDYFIDPYAIYERYDDKVQLIIDGGFGNLHASTVVNCTLGHPEIIRQGNWRNRDMILVVDCGSSKTRFIEQIVDEFIDVKVASLMDFKQEDLQGIQGVIFSGAPLLVTEIDMTPYLEKIEWVKTTEIPVLGICFGHQLIGLLFGAFASKMKEDRDWQVVEAFVDCPLFDRLPDEVEMMQDHCETISVPPGFEHVASSDACVNETMQHTEKPIFGVQFHPEVSGNHGRVVIENFINYCLR